MSTHSQIQNGFVAGSERKPTNCAFLFLFLAFLIAMVVCSVIGFVKGDPHTLIAGVDSEGRICGQSDGVTEFPNLYYFLLADSRLAAGAACVQSCPTTDATGPLACASTTALNGGCTITRGYATQEILGYCVPVSADTFGAAA